MTTDRASYPRRRDAQGGGVDLDAPPATGTDGRPPTGPHPTGRYSTGQHHTGPYDTGQHHTGQYDTGLDGLALIPDGDGGRGRHATGRGDGFGRLLGFTMLGALLPGAGLVAAGRRVVGWCVLLPFLFVAGGLVAVAVTGRGVGLLRQEIFQPQAMLVAAAAFVGVGALWCLVIVVSHFALRRERLTRWQRLLSLVLVTALMLAVALPTATAARYALVDRSLLLNVFDAGTGVNRSGLAAPEVGSANPWAHTPRVNVLLVGADSSQGHEGTRPDTVMVASINTHTGDTVLFGLPRQLADVPFPPGSAAASAWPKACAANGQGGCILNAAYLFGVQNPQYFPHAADPGLEATRAAASGITGLRIDYETMINLDGFEGLVDAMGGIRLTINHAYPIGGGHILGSHGQTVGNYPVTGHLPVGKDLHLNGYQAEWYVRSRADSDNNDRMNRQRCFVNAAVHQYSVVALAKAFPALAASAEKDFATDISAKELNAFVDLGLKVKGGSLRALSFDSPEGTDTSKPDYTAIHRQVQAALKPAPKPSPSASTAPGASPSVPSPAPAPASPTATSGSAGGQAVDADSVCPS